MVRRVEECLPAELRAATVTKIAAGLSGAGVYRVEAAGQAFVLKITSDTEPLAHWQRNAHIQTLAAAAGIAPRVAHVDERRRAIVSAFVVDRSLPALYGNPQTRDAAIALLGHTLRRVHELPMVPGDATPRDQRAFLGTMWSGLAGFLVPAFVADAVHRELAEEPPACDRPVVLSHNDVNPSNLCFDGEHLLLLDWDSAGPNDPFFDLAAIAMFLRMDDAACLRLLAAHDETPVATLPARFLYDRRLVAVLCAPHSCTSHARAATPAARPRSSRPCRSSTCISACAPVRSTSRAQMASGRSGSRS